MVDPRELVLIGCREWVALPDLRIRRLRAKIDTGARTSSLHADDIERYRVAGRDRVRFIVHPYRGDTRKIVRCTAELRDERVVRSSTGHEEARYVIGTTLAWGGVAWPIEVSLTSRHGMRYRMLIGRRALRGRCLVDPARASLLGQDPASAPPGA